MGILGKSRAFTVILPEWLREGIEREAERRGVSRSAVIRWAISEFCPSDKKAVKAEQAPKEAQHA